MNSLLKAIVLLLMASAAQGTLNAQQQDGVITLLNPSFEDMPRHSKPPRGWIDCGSAGETPVDVQPSGTFSVTKPAYDGETYLGMVVRDNDTWEMVSQRLSAPMKKGTCYEFSIFLCRSELYVSYSRLSDETANYTTPAKLRIYGGFDYCDKQYLLGETNLVINTRWLEYRFKFDPLENYSHISFEAFYKTPTLFPYNGNILADKASAITPIPCDEALAEKEEPKQPEQKPVSPNPLKKPDTTTAGKPGTSPAQPVSPAPRTEPAAPEPKPAVVENVDFSKVKRSDLRKGQTLRLEGILFEVDRSVIARESYTALNEVVNFMLENSDIAIEIGGHTNGLCSDTFCDQLSTARAKVVSEYIAQRGISRTRLQYKGYGKRFPIAGNDTPEGRRKNQRVEIKILDIGN
jgi:outer membrane protein OmpA-like peptidoglycan-associated protein